MNHINVLLRSFCHSLVDTPFVTHDVTFFFFFFFYQANVNNFPSYEDMKIRKWIMKGGGEKKDSDDITSF